MRSFGSDRLRRGRGEQMILVCRRAKGWVARVPRTLTRREHPGTAVLWEDRYFEVVAEEISGDSVRYILEPWRDENAIRVTDAYDEASEARRETEHRAAIKRTAGRHTANILGILTGNLPAVVQEKLGSELGVLPTRLTLASLLLPLLFEIWAFNVMARSAIAHTGTPLWLLVAAGYIALESWIRLHILFGQSRPIGSTAGFILYSLFYALAPRRAGAVAPIKIEKREAIFGSAAPPEVALRDAYHLREPLLTLLSPAEQAALAERFGFDYRKHAFRLAWIILIFAIAGIVTSVVTLRSAPTLSALISLILASVLAAEQLGRLRALPRGPAGSILGLVVRPLARKLFV